jgi:prepilin-type N-terminal cleavage/methylation domain-containing protein
MVTRFLPQRLSGSVAVKKSCGFTLVELVITIVLLGLLASVGTGMLSDSFSTTYMVNASQSNQAQARYAMERLVREIREIKYNSSTSQYCIDTISWAGSSSLTFKKMTATGVANLTPTDCSTEVTQVSISIIGGTSLSLGGSTLLANVTSNPSNVPLLTYYQADGSAATDAGNLSVIYITLTVTNPISGDNITLRSRVALRNIG